MTQKKPRDRWVENFPIQSAVDLDYVFGQHLSWPVGITRESPIEFKQRIKAAAISYQLRLKSIDYTLKQYVPPEPTNIILGDEISDFLKKSLRDTREELNRLYIDGYAKFGEFASEITLVRIPDMIDTSRMLANRGLFLEIVPILRTNLEMLAWVSKVYFIENDDLVKSIEPQKCVAHLKKIYEPAGSLYGMFSKYTHWNYNIHPKFFNTDEKIS